MLPPFDLRNDIQGQAAMARGFLEADSLANAISLQDMPKAILQRMARAVRWGFSVAHCVSP
jgi:hypothetical protein